MKKYISPNLHCVTLHLEESVLLALSMNDQVEGDDQLTQEFDTENTWESEE